MLGRAPVRRTALLALLLALATLWSRPAAAEDAGDRTDVCLAQHQQGQLLHRAGKLLEAREALQQCAAESCPSQLRSDCVKWIDALDASIPSIVPAARLGSKDLTEVSVFANGTLLTAHLDGQPIELNPGVYQFRFVVPNQKAAHLDVVLRAGQRNRLISVQLAAPEQPAVAPGPCPVCEKRACFDPPTESLVLAGATVGLVAVAAYFGFQARNDLDAARLDCAPNCTEARRQTIATEYLVANVAGGLAVLASGAAVVIYLARPADEPSGARADRVTAAGIPDASGWLLGVRGRL